MFPDFERYGILWMGRKPLATAYDMEGAFNDVALTLTGEAKTEDVIDRLDDLLKPYGGLGAYARKDQLSHRYLSEEFRQLEQMATIFPIIFLAVAAFLLNVVVSRLINTQREEIAILKAFGYSNLTIGVHYLKLVLIIVLVGGIGGLLLGIRFGQGLSNMYMDFYRFPFIAYELPYSYCVSSCHSKLCSGYSRNALLIAQSRSSSSRGGDASGTTGQLPRDNSRAYGPQTSFLPANADDYKTHRAKTGKSPPYYYRHSFFLFNYGDRQFFW